MLDYDSLLFYFYYILLEVGFNLVSTVVYRLKPKNIRALDKLRPDVLGIYFK